MRARDVGIRLITEIMDHAPEMTAAQWRALVILAEDANDKTRLTWSSVQSKKIVDRVGLPLKAWANLRTALVRKGLLEIAESGVKGRVAKYRFPEYGKMPHRSDEESAAEPTIPHQIHEESGPIPHRSDEASAECLIDSMTPTPLYSSKDTPLSPQATLVRAACVVHEDEEREFIDWIKKTHEPRGMPWWRKIADNGDFPTLAEDWREHAVGAALLRREFAGSGSQSNRLPECPRCGAPFERGTAPGTICLDCKESA